MTVMGLATLLEARLKGKVVVVGVGNIDSGDDGIGVVLAERLRSSSRLRAMEAGTAPEFFLPEVIREAPDVVMFVDSADLGYPPGSAALVERGQLARPWSSSHRPSLSSIMTFVAEETGADTFLLALQPKNPAWERRLSTAAMQAVVDLSRMVQEIVAKTERSSERGLL